MNIGELNQKLVFVRFNRADEALVTKEVLTEVKTYIEEDRNLDNKMGYPGELTPKEYRQREEDYKTIVSLLETFKESGE